MHRFILPNSDLYQKNLIITDAKEIHHLTNVLRLQKNSQIIIFNGKGQEAIAKIDALSPKNIQITITSTVKNSSQNQITLSLACAIPKKAKFETIIEKCTELGADRIIPVLTQRTEIRLNPQQQEKKHQRFQTVAVNAAKQCHRDFLPVIDHPTDFNEVLKNLTPCDAAFIPCLTGKRQNLLNAFHLSPEQNNAIFFIGPEGDFTPQELKNALSAGCIPVTLGPHTLKVDTAAVCVIAAAKLLLEKNNE